jgi:hypothetical protein
MQIDNKVAAYNRYSLIISMLPPLLTITDTPSGSHNPSFVKITATTQLERIWKSNTLNICRTRVPLLLASGLKA